MQGKPNKSEVLQDALLGVFAENLCERMAVKGWSQRDLERETGIHRTMVGKYLSGTRWPHPTYLVRLADALGVTPAGLLSAQGRSAWSAVEWAYDTAVKAANGGRNGCKCAEAAADARTLARWLDNTQDELSTLRFQDKCQKQGA